MNNIEVILKYLETAEAIGSEEVILKGFDVRVLNDYIKTQKEKIRQLSGLSVDLSNEIVNLNEIINKIEL